MSQSLEIQQRSIEILSSLSYRTGQLSGYLESIAQGVSELLNLEWVVVTLCQAGVEKVLASTRDLGEDRDRVYSLHGSLAERVILQNSPVVIEDARLNQGNLPEGYLSYLGVPLRSPTGEILGTICAFGREPHSLTPAEVKLAEIFAERAATAIDNYQLYQQQRAFNQDLEAEVAKRTEELKFAQNQLELRVEQRTAELRQAVEQLQAEIQERQQIEAALRESEGRFRTLLDNAADAIFVINDQNQIIDVNQQACTSLGYTRSELLKFTVFEIEKKRSPQEMAATRQQLRLGSPQTLEGIHQRQDGTTFPVEVRVALFESGGQTLELALARDITERQQAQLSCERLAELGEFAATIIHEVRNPLTTVLLGLNAFKQLELSEIFQSRLSLALEEAERLQRLLNEILAYAKPQALQEVELELNQFITQMLDSLRQMPSAMGRQIQFTPSQTAIQVRGDADKLKQVLINLIANACEAVGEGELIQTRISSQMNRVCVQIQNGGDPIPPEILAKIIQPFYTTKPAGNGLGLAIVKQIVEAHGGQLRIESDAIAGTLASIDLPMAIAPKKVETLSTPLPQTPNSPKLEFF
ncbi:PAS domain S-box protein [Desertifilum sp. FACHB-1129]|uniref:histidine kinase n=1 Tax=Desertifilum tharense IPPAS B-1220 TaxID=1781255 RepID=A0A1E5QJU7_9CYAN|nr:MULTISPECIES: GAF domain-containing sensor histidine kinase [Desertifilum]MDA0210400.1 PAS domain S-box protein [Cyanobacteria bacterium FC1]MBD2313963.1 PAS domain S-box protein [Desertifilum sp. FACHB-1129]MBD2324795.1 PAS domain S-box protein [Desertifilum sp. FACHB-866]MBD2334811.1 PAS domain S-box protein [Desertifilum sp. FACHB-868]OEJ74969.1 hypothetical protein BH720_11540 [Desertifilum tharense IPPAS B-1220]